MGMDDFIIKRKKIDQIKREIPKDYSIDYKKIEIQFVGGCIRDALMEKKIFDIDFSINCDPNTTAKVLSNNNIAVLEYGKKYGTITAVIKKNRLL